MKNKAFTLAEVLITLGIIGVVAAMTLPALIQKRTNTEVESKLKKIYTTMNQAILMSELDNGPKEYWQVGCNGDCEGYFKKYLLPYLNESSVLKFNSFGGENIVIYFADGTALVGKQAIDYFFFPNAKNLDIETFASTSEDGSLKGRKDCGVTYFAFAFYPTTKIHVFHHNKGFEPYKFELTNFDYETLTGSNSYACNKNSKLKVWCTALIQLNGWKIPNDYPFKVK